MKPKFWVIFSKKFYKNINEYQFIIMTNIVMNILTLFGIKFLITVSIIWLETKCHKFWPFLPNRAIAKSMICTIQFLGLPRLNSYVNYKEYWLYGIEFNIRSIQFLESFPSFELIEMSRIFWLTNVFRFNPCFFFFKKFDAFVVIKTPTIPTAELNYYSGRIYT